MDFEPDFLRHIFPRINWAALREAAAAMGERLRLRGASLWDPDRGSSLLEQELRWLGSGKPDRVQRLPAARQLRVSGSCCCCAQAGWQSPGRADGGICCPAVQQPLSAVVSGSSFWSA